MVHTQTCLRCFWCFQTWQNGELMHSFADHEKDKKGYYFVIIGDDI